MDGDTSALESVDRLLVQGVGSLAVAQQRARPGLGPERPVCADRACSFLESSQRGGGLLVSAASGTRLHELDEGETDETEVLVLACPSGARQRGLVAAETVVQHSSEVADP